MSDYPWENGVFNPACVCGGSINRVNDDCERCAMHDWIYKQAAEIERLREELESVKSRRIHWQDLAYAGMRVIDAVAGNRLECGEGVTEDTCKTAVQMAIDKVAFLKAEIERLRDERNEAREAARWLRDWVDESQWTHFTEEDMDHLKEFPWLE